MTVFKAYFLIIRRNLVTILIYICIFIGISALIQASYQETGAAKGFTAMKQNVAVVDREGGVLGGTLHKFLQMHHNLVEIKDEQQMIQEELYYNNVQYVLVIPEKASQKLEAGQKAVQSITGPNTISAYYVEAGVNALLNQIRVCIAGGFSLEESCQKALEISQTTSEVELQDMNGNAGIREDYNYYFAFMPYAFLGAAVMSMSIVIMEFKKKEIRRRMQSSSLPFHRQTTAVLISFAAVGAGIWGVCIAVQAVMYHGGVFTSPNVGYYLLNSAVFMVVALSLSYLTGILSGSPAALNGINNVISLGLCFLGGIFVPMEMLGEKIERVSRFLPTYWYSRINGMLGDYAKLGTGMRKEIWMGMAVQLLFGAACLAVTLAIRRMQMQQRE